MAVFQLTSWFSAPIRWTYLCGTTVTSAWGSRRTRKRPGSRFRAVSIPFPAAVMTYACGTSIPGRCVQKSKLRMMARGADLEETASGKPRHLLARDKSFACPEVAIGDSAQFCEVIARKGMHILDVDAMGVSAKFDGRTFAPSGAYGAAGFWRCGLESGLWTFG